MTPQQRQHLLQIPYRIGGRSNRCIDCLGVVLHVLQLHGKKQLDPWHHLLQAYRDNDVEARHAFGPDWQRVQGEPLNELDVLLFHEAHSWAAIVEGGSVWSAHPHVGVWCKPLHRFGKRPHEVWRMRC